MDTFYVFNEYGDFQFTTTDEDYASAWCDANEGYYGCEEQPSQKIKKFQKTVDKQEPMCYYNNVRSGQASRGEQTQVVTVRPVKCNEHPENNPRWAAEKPLQKNFLKKVLTNNTNRCIINT